MAGELSFGDFRVLRVKTDLGDDADFAADQVQPAAADVVTVRYPGATRVVEPIRVKIEVVVEWLDSVDAVVVGSDRGAYDVQAIRVLSRQSISGTLICDSALLSKQIGHRPVMIDDVMAGDSFTVRLSNITGPSGAEKVRVLYREIF